MKGRITQVYIYIKIGYLIDIPKIECYQYYLLLAYYLEQYGDTKKLAFEFYKKVLVLERKSFPRLRFYQFLDSFDYNELKSMQNDTKDKLVYISYITSAY